MCCQRHFCPFVCIIHITVCKVIYLQNTLACTFLTQIFYFRKVLRSIFVDDISKPRTYLKASENVFLSQLHSAHPRDTYVNLAHHRRELINPYILYHVFRSALVTLVPLRARRHLPSGGSCHPACRRRLLALAPLQRVCRARHLSCTGSGLGRVGRLKRARLRGLC